MNPPQNLRFIYKTPLADAVGMAAIVILTTASWLTNLAEFIMKLQELHRYG